MYDYRSKLLDAGIEIDLEVIFSFLEELNISEVSYKFLDRATDLTDRILF